MKKIMEKSKYIQPEISICHVETDRMMATSTGNPSVSMTLLTGTLRC